MDSPILKNSIAREAFFEAWHSEAMQLWLDETPAICNECGCPTEDLLVEKVWEIAGTENPFTGHPREHIAGTFCNMCAYMYTVLLRDVFAESYWTAVTIGARHMTRAQYEQANVTAVHSWPQRRLSEGDSNG